jgi:hypothetical protein
MKGKVISFTIQIICLNSHAAYLVKFCMKSEMDQALTLIPLLLACDSYYLFSITGDCSFSRVGLGHHSVLFLVP